MPQASMKRNNDYGTAMRKQIERRICIPLQFLYNNGFEQVQYW